ncbi:sugar ABC transporter substrate-binding protein [Candidatus Dojkabacteria bacterium]|nr:sugar ABC transporter substrate-binding protein [Candidatus Dojkabacteria bacterium]
MMDKKKLVLIIVFGVIVIAAAIGFIYYRTTQNQSGSGGKVELVYWGLWEPEEHMREVIEEYESENPNVTIKYTQKRFTQYEENIYERLTDSKTTPDIVRINNTWTYKFQSRLSSVPPEIMSSSEYQETFYPTALDDFTGTDGKLYAIPLEVDGLAMYYNKDLFAKAGIEEVPQDWDTFIEVAQKLTETDSSGDIVTAGAGIGCSTNINHSADILFALMLQNNVQMTTSDGVEASFDSTRGEAAMKYYVDFAKEHKVWSCGLRNDLEMFTGGKLAIMFAPSWRVFDIINMNSSINFDVAPFPQLPANDVDVYYSMYWGDAVSAQSQNQLEAWKFIKFLSEKEQLKKMYAAESKSRTFGEPYSRVDLADEIKDSPYAGVFIQMAPSMVSWKLGDQKTTEDAINTAISDVVDGRETESAALKDAVDTINSKNQEIYSQ